MIFLPLLLVPFLLAACADLPPLAAAALIGSYVVGYPLFARALARWVRGR